VVEMLMNPALTEMYTKGFKDKIENVD